MAAAMQVHETEAVRSHAGRPMQDIPDVVDGEARVLGVRPRPGVVTVVRTVLALHVVDLEAELLQTPQVVEVVERHTCNRDLSDESDDDGERLAAAGHRTTARRWAD